MKNTVFNFRQLLIWGFTALILFFAIVSLVVDQNHLLFFGFLIFVLAGFFVSFVTPIYFIFDQEKLRIQYFFGFHEIIYYTNIYSIEKVRDGGKPPSLYSYDIATWSLPEGKRAFFTNGRINATKKTRDLLRKYWKADFEGKKGR